LREIRPLTQLQLATYNLSIVNLNLNLNKNPLSPFLPCFTTTNEGKESPDSIPKKSLTTNFHCKGTGTVIRPINGNVNVNGTEVIRIRMKGKYSSQRM
jgi:hypothetical protein